MRLFLIILTTALLTVVNFCATAAATELTRLPHVMPASEPAVFLAMNLEATARPLPEVYKNLTPPPFSIELMPKSERMTQLETILPDGTTSVSEAVEEEIWERPVDARNGFFQELDFSAAWLPRWQGEKNFGWADLSVDGSFVLPLPSRRHPLMIKPGFTVHYLDADRNLDLPRRLYNAYCQFRWLHKINPRWSADLSVTPMVSSDFEQDQSEAFRFTGHGGAMFEWTDRFDLLLGVAYLNSDLIRMLPFVGFVWKPNDETEIMATIPRPSFGRRVYWFGNITEECQDWVYLAGELGTGTWAIKRPETGIEDVISYLDYRLVLGLERRVLFGLDYGVELAWVFGRELEGENSIPEIRPADTLMVRFSTNY
jgi:hypothetical protein